MVRVALQHRKNVLLTKLGRIGVWTTTFPTQAGSRYLLRRKTTQVRLQGTESKEGRWAKGTAPDGKGQFEYLENPEGESEMPDPPAPNPRLHSTGKS